MKRILHTVYSLSAGGIESMVTNFLRYIDKDKYQFDFVVNFYDEEHIHVEFVKSLGCKIFVVSDNGNFDDFVKAWHKILSENNYDIIHGHLPITAFVYLPLAKRLNIKTILHCHTSSGDEPEDEEFYLEAPKFADFKIACSKVSGNWIYQNDDFSVIKNGIKTDDFIYKEEFRNEVRKEFGVFDEIVIGHVGRLATVKNHSFLLDIFAEILKKERNAKLLIVGEGPLYLQIKEKAENLGILENIIFTGVRKDTNKIFMALDLLLLPSLFEGLPVVLVEAQASGLPAIASNVVTKEVDISGLVEFISLEETAEFWAEKALETIRNTKNSQNFESQENDENSQGYENHKEYTENRKKYAQIVKDNGYDIVDTVKKLEEIYDNL